MNVEQEEAKRAMDALAREIHGIYGQHAAEAGLSTPKWEELPERTRAVSRDIARLVLSKMHEAYAEGSKAQPQEKPQAGAPPKMWTPEDVVKVVNGAKPALDSLIQRIKDTDCSPIVEGIDNAVRRVAEKLSIDVLTENADLASRLRSLVERSLVNALSSTEEEDEA